MCGIFGVIIHKQGIPIRARERAKTLFNVLAVSAAERGIDATGVARVQRSGEVLVYKDTIPSYHILRRDNWKQMLEAFETPETFAMLGHTRRKSHGDNVPDNAHPFIFDSEHGVLVGTHNGVISNHTLFGPSEQAFSVDSANLFHGLSKEPTENWPEVLELIRGNFALAMSRKGVVYLTRNTGSPCYVAYAREINATIYGSLSHMLQSAAAMAGVTLDQLRSLKEGRLMAFDQHRRRPVGTGFVAYKEPDEIGDAYEETVSEMIAAGIDTDKEFDDDTYAAPERGIGVEVKDCYSKGKTVSYLCTGCTQWIEKERLFTLPSGRMICGQCKDNSPRSKEISRAIKQHARDNGGITTETAMSIAYQLGGSYD